MARPKSQMPDQPDLLDCVLERVAAELGVSIDQLGVVDDWARQTFGGEHFYVPQASTRRRRERWQQIAHAYNGRNLREVIHQFGVSKTTVFECVKRYRKSPGF